MNTFIITQLSDPIAHLLGDWSRELNPGSVLLRIVIVVVLSAIIGCERSSKRHSAGLRTFVLISFTSTISMILDIYLMDTFSFGIPVLSAATIISTALISGNSILFSSRSQIKGLTTSAGLWACSILGFTIGAGMYTITLIVYLFLLCILACFPAFEVYLKNRSNHFEIHLELKSSEYLRDFVTVSRRLGLRIDDIEPNQAYVGSGLSVYTITFTICSPELKKYKTHREIIQAISSLDYIYHIEEMR
ncbi:MAG: MgtC/SapB family protein [Lachnospiraceae bacterium]|jgi:putative Mg2+ transporter-C (MgtC) family protein|nr:MgtC/SapB family protein [Lachnospiraceae bacterium]